MDRNDIISYLSWCEAQGIEPFGEDEKEASTGITNGNNDKIDIDKEKIIKIERRNKK